MLAYLPALAALAVGQTSPEFSQVNRFGAVRLELPLTAGANASDGSYVGSRGGVDFKLTISRAAGAGAPTTKNPQEASAKLKAAPGMKSYRGGSVLPAKLGSASGWLLRFNFLTQDGQERLIDELIVPVNGQIYDFELQADRHDAKAVAWLSRSYASLRADLKNQKDAKIASFTSDGLAWQNWRSTAIRLAMLVPHTPYVAPGAATSDESSVREGNYADNRYGIHFTVIELKADAGQSVADLLQKDLALYAVPDGKLAKPAAGKWRTVDGAPASLAECSVETPQGTTRLVLLDILKDRMLYKFALSAPAADAEASRNVDRIIESIKLLPPPAGGRNK